MSNRQTAAIPRSVYNAIQSMKVGIAKCQAYDVILAYAFDGTEPDPAEHDGAIMTLFEMAKVLIDTQGAQA